MLGERGVTLSGGQRQRLTIARALIGPPILILDDALSMVDTRTEERILNGIMEIRRNKTNLIVSHRVSTISRADRIIVLDRANFWSRGAIMSFCDGGVYARLYKKQQLARELEWRVISVFGEYGYMEEGKLGKPYNFRLLKRLARYAVPYKKTIVSAFLLSILLTLCDLAIPYLSKIAIDRYILSSWYRVDMAGQKNVCRILSPERSFF